MGIWRGKIAASLKLLRKRAKRNKDVLHEANVDVTSSTTTANVQIRPWLMGHCWGGDASSLKPGTDKKTDSKTGCPFFLSKDMCRHGVQRSIEKSWPATTLLNDSTCKQHWIVELYDRALTR